MKRREYLTGLAGVGTLSAAGGQVGAESDVRRLSLSGAVGDDTHHPGPPRFGHVGETFYDRPFTDFSNDHAGGKDRDSFGPRIKGTPQQDPDNYSPDDFSWSIVDAPEGSSAALEYRPPDNDIEQYDHGQDNVAEFAPDVPGQYVFELEAPDGTHQQILHIFPEDEGDGGPPRISLDGHYDGDAGEFVVESNPKLAPDSSQTDADVVVEWIADNRDSLDTEDIEIDEETWAARIPESALDGTARLHAAPYDGAKAGYSDSVVLNLDEQSVENPTHPPEWIEEGIMYEIFPRSFEGTPKEGEWPFENSNAHFSAFEDRLDYLESLNVDVLWFTPIVPSESGNWKPQAYLRGDERDRFRFVGGGPHGYDALSYTEIAEDLGSEYSVQDYYNEPYPWEDGYDPENNLREAARQNAMEEFQSFVEAAHERDIRICFDFVINHGGRHHPMFQDTIESESDFRPSGWTYNGIESYDSDSKYFDWFNRKAEPNMTDDGEQIVDPEPAATGFAGLRVMPEWNYNNVALREHILAAADYLSGEVGIDAFRCDIAYGVPHDFWKEIRDVVRANDSDFMTLDETIPNDPDFAENEFGLHFDTSDFMAGAGHGVVNGGDPMQLYDAVAKREKEGWPDHSRILNSTENHDEQRLYKIARDGSRDDPAKAQRAVWAAGVVLPGVPFIYYGQERLITEYGTTRYDYDGSGEDNRAGDVGPNTYKRAFMNWDETDEEHLEFYRKVTQLYKDHDILKPHADAQKTWFNSDDSVLVFGRSMETDDGEQKVVVMVHFDPGTAQVDLLPGSETTDLVSGDDIGVGSDGQAVSVEFETLAMVETDTLFAVGNQIAELSEETGDDYGPGSYEYPTGDAYEDGAFDISAATVHTTADGVQFRIAVDGNLSNPEGYDGGITAQHLQFYMRDPEAEDGATEGRAGTNVTFEDPYQYRLIADGENGARVEDYEGNVVTEGSLTANPVADEIVVEMPKDALEGSIRSYYVAPLMLGYHPDGEGGVMPVQSEASAQAFGDTEPPEGVDPAEMAPRVIDMVAPETADQTEALAYTAEETATLPYTSLASEFARIGQAVDEEGDDHGPGNFQYPSGPESEHYEGMWDVTGVQVYESRSRVKFEYTFASEIQNVWGLNGMSQQFPQIYIRDPEAEDLPSTTEGREGLNVNFAEPYHYRVIVHGEGTQQVENADGEAVSTDVNLSVQGNTVSIDLPMSAIGGSPEGKQIASLVAPYDGFGTGGVRQNFASQPGDYTIGTSGEPTETAPHVMDMITPAGVSQAAALAYTESSKAQIPLATWEGAYVQTSELTIDDPEGDDNGPGSYTYPTSDQIPEGCLDVTQVDIEDTTSSWDFTVHIAGSVANPWSYNDGFSPQLFQLYFRDPNAGDDVPTASGGRTGMTSSFQENYHYRVYVDGNSQMLENANGDVLAEDFETEADQDANTISFSVPKASFDTNSIKQMKMTMLVFSQDGFGEGGIRQNFSTEASEWAFGGVEGDAVQNAPRVVDIVGPDEVVDQGSALSYGADSRALIPLYSADALVTGEGAGGTGIQAIAAPGPELFGTTEGTLDASKSSDPNDQELSFQWEQIGGPDTELSDADTAKPTFVAPDVDEESTLEFEVTVTNEDGDSATATTSATVIPQSANDAPIADAGEDQTAEPGTVVSLQATNSEDPNGGTLSFQWEQTSGPEVSLGGADSVGPAFQAPEVDEETTLTFQVTVSDGQGKTATDTINVTVQPETDGMTTTTDGETTTETEGGETTTDTGDGDGPGFGIVSGALGTAGGVAYAAKSLLADDEPAADEEE
ncbi:MAG: glucodextranase DOMON-like domain-containing protein [Halapricum sp.]